MKFTVQIVATIIICFALQYLLPWWTMALGAFGVAYFMGNNGWVSFVAGLIAVGALWAATAYYTDVTTHAILTEKVNRLLPLNAMLMTVIVGGLVGGFASLTGALAKNLQRS